MFGVSPEEWWASQHPWGYPDVAALDEERVRRIVREELADLLRPHVPDAPPEGLT